MPLQHPMCRHQLPFRPHPLQPTQCLVRQQHRLIEATLSLAIPEQRNANHHQLARRFALQQQNRLRHPPPQQARNCTNPGKLQQADQPSHLVVIACVSDGPCKLRFRQPALSAQKTLRQHSGKSCIFQIKIEVQCLAAFRTPKHRVPPDAPHARLTHRNSRSPLQRTLTTLAICRKESRNNIVQYRSSPTSKNSHDGAPAFHPTGWTCRIDSELGIQAIAEDSPTRRRSRSIGPRHDRSISQPHHNPSRISQYSGAPSSRR